MSSKPFLVALMGGPCAGKSSAIAFLRYHLSKAGFQALTLPETASLFWNNSEGFQLEWSRDETKLLDMQHIFLRHQMAVEDAFCKFAKLHPRKRSILILDCCTLNSKLYLSDAQWDKLLKLSGNAFTEEQLLNRYDLVIHMNSCAFTDAYEWGPDSNNPGRHHSPEQANELDRRCSEVLQAHPQLREVPRFEDFDAKLRKVLNFVTDALQVEGLAGKRRRTVVEITSQEKLMEQVSSGDSFIVTSNYLDKELLHCVRRIARVPCQFWVDQKMQRFSSSTLPVWEDEAFQKIVTDVMYERRTKVQQPSRTCLTRKIITETEYSSTVESTNLPLVATRCVLRFVLQSGYYELFFFLHHEKLMLDLDEGTPIPDWIKPIDVSLADTCKDVGSVKRRRLLASCNTEDSLDMITSLQKDN